MRQNWTGTLPGWHCPLTPGLCLGTDTRKCGNCARRLPSFTSAIRPKWSPTKVSLSFYFSLFPHPFFNQNILPKLLHFSLQFTDCTFTHFTDGEEVQAEVTVHHAEKDDKGMEFPKMSGPFRVFGSDSQFGSGSAEIKRRPSRPAPPPPKPKRTFTSKVQIHIGSRPLPAIPEDVEIDDGYAVVQWHFSYWKWRVSNWKTLVREPVYSIRGNTVQYWTHFLMEFFVWNNFVRMYSYGSYFLFEYFFWI